MSFAVILPFLRPIEHLILDAEISEIMVNPSGSVFVERLGELTEIPGVVLDKKHLEIAVKSIARRLGDDISEEKPILDSRLPDGARVAAMFAPCSVGGTTLTIRKFQNRYFDLSELVRFGTVTEQGAKLLSEAVLSRKNILISGGTGAGKTTLLNALAALIPEGERVIVIEDTLEIHLSRPNVVRWEAQVSRPGASAITIRELVRASLRHRPDRLIVGEVRGGEAFDLLQALNTGHAGTISTLHANSAAHALNRFTNCILESAVELPYSAIRASIAASLDVIVQIERQGRKRLVTEVAEVVGYSIEHDKFEIRGVRHEQQSSSDVRPHVDARCGRS
jgi:pilus assembly protein CpaF